MSEIRSEIRSKTNARAQLQRAGVNPYGSEALQLFEQRLTAAFARSYRQAGRAAQTLADPTSSSGPMVEQTEDLMQVHYDEHLAFFESILDRDYLAYSAAYYGDTPHAARASSFSLEQAQHAKFELLCARARLEGRERVFNLGCGFGSLETFLLTKYPEMQITGITPSKTQAAYLRTRMENPDDPLGDGRFQLIEDRFDTASVETLGPASYDLVFSVGVLEHFKNLRAAFERAAELLKPGGRAFHHLIASECVLPGFADASRTRLRTYFPGGRIWPVAVLESQTDFFSLEGSWFVNGLNYWRTVDAWHQRFWTHIEQLHPAVLTEKGVRYWNDYFSFSKVMFAPEDGGVVGNGQFLFYKD